MMENQSSVNPPVPAPSNSGKPLMGAGALLGKAWEIFRAKFTIIIQIAVLATVVQVLYTALTPLLKDLSFLLGIVSLFISLWLGLSLLYVVKDRGEKISAKEALSRGWKRVFSYWWISVLSGFIVVGGYLLLVIPGIILSVWFVLAGYILVSEDLRGMNALFRSKQLVSGYWWGVFGRFLVLVLVVFATMIPLIILTAIIGGPGYFSLEESNGELESRLAVQLVASLHQWLIVGFTAAFGFLLYEDLKRAKGNPVFEEPSNGTKRKYAALGILPFVLIPIVLILIGLGSLWAILAT